MKNQYFGDINDYRKYGLLRNLARGDFSVLVAWMLTPNDERSDGKFISYLNDSVRWRRLDPELFDHLYETIIRRGARSTSEIEKTRLLGKARFINTVLDDTPVTRASFVTELRTASTGVDLVFFDPDNGLEVSSTSKSSKGASKYLFWDEVEIAWQNGPSLFIYQHFPRMQRDLFLELVASQFRTRLGASSVVACVTANVAFFLVPQGPRSEELISRASRMASDWRGQIMVRTL